MGSIDGTRSPAQEDESWMQEREQHIQLMPFRLVRLIFEVLNNGSVA